MPPSASSRRPWRSTAGCARRSPWSTATRSARWIPPTAAPAVTGGGITSYFYYAPWGLTSQGALYALFFQRHKLLYGTTDEQLGADRGGLPQARLPEPQRRDAEAAHHRGLHEGAVRRRAAAPLRLLPHQRRRRRDHRAPRRHGEGPQAEARHGERLRLVRGERRRHAAAAASQGLLSHGAPRRGRAGLSHGGRDAEGRRRVRHLRQLQRAPARLAGGLRLLQGGRRRARSCRTAASRSAASCPATRAAACSPRATCRAGTTSPSSSASCAAASARARCEGAEVAQYVHDVAGKCKSIIYTKGS